MKKILGICLTFIALAMTAGCSKTDKNLGLLEEGKLYVATSSDYAPLEFVDTTKTGQERFVGSDMALARYIAQELGLELIIKAMGFDATLTAVENKRVDLVISGITADDERRAKYEFSESYYQEGITTLVVRSSDIDKYNTLADFNHSTVKIAAQGGSVQEGLVDTQLPNANKVVIEDLQNALTLLESGTYDAVAMASIPAKTAVAVKKQLSLAKCSFAVNEEDTYLYVLTAKNNTKLMDAINKLIKKVNDEKLYDQWAVEAQALFDGLGDNAGEIIPEE